MKITLFSNGTAFVNRTFPLSGGQRSKVSIPVKKEYLDEVVASIDILGDVSVPSPPSFKPTNSEKAALSLNTVDIVRDLAEKLAGTRAEVSSAGKNYTGILMGIQEFKRAVANGQVIDDFKISLLNDEGAAVVLDMVQSIRPLDASVQAEVAKAMRACAERIKPDSTFVDLEICNTSEFATEAAVCYSIPSAAWKTSYRLRRHADQWKLESMAIVDNDTDEDWKDCTVSVVTGQPITFSTDLAEAKIPARKRVNVVSQDALGAVNYEAAIRPASAKSGRMLTNFPASNSVSPSVRMADYCGGDIPCAAPAPAQREMADHTDVGDFAVFSTKKPVTVEANRSAIVPMFEVDLDVKSLLYFNSEHHATRPYRSIRFKNTSPYAMNRGILTCVDEGTLLGKAVLDGTKPGEDVTVVHALETGVRVSNVITPRDERVSSVEIKNGTYLSQRVFAQDSKFTVCNSKAEAFEFEIEYKRLWNGSKVAVKGAEKLAEVKDGVRVSFTLAANETKDVLLHEESVQSDNLTIADENGVSWLSSQDILKDKAAVKKVIAIKDEVDELQAKASQLTNESETILQTQERLKGLIPVSSDAQANEWRSELAKNEKRWREIKSELLPSLASELKLKRKAMRTELKNLNVTWREEL